MHTDELAGYQWDSRGWLLRAIPYTDPELLHAEDLVWPAGINNLRIQYTAGYSTIPESVQEACAEWTAAMYRKPPRLRRARPGGATIGRLESAPVENRPASAGLAPAVRRLAG